MDISELSKVHGRKLGRLFQEADSQVFAETDCLSCANCCKTAGPILTESDFPRMAKALQITVSTLLQDYVEMDEDGDFIMRSLPCPLLQTDNTCSIYEDRPEACRDYPHTNRKDIKQYLDILEPNVLVCPAAERIVHTVLNRIASETKSAL